MSVKAAFRSSSSSSNNCWLTAVCAEACAVPRAHSSIVHSRRVMGASPPRTVSCEGDEEGDEYVRFTVSVTRRKMREVLVGWLFGEDAASRDGHWSRDT